jgi:hypothetical protein
MTMNGRIVLCRENIKGIMPEGRTAYLYNRGYLISQHKIVGCHARRA